MPRLQGIHASLLDRMREAEEQGWLGEVAAIKATLAAAKQKRIAMRSAAAKHTTTTLGMPSFDPAVGRSLAAPGLEPIIEAKLHLGHGAVNWLQQRLTNRT
jgi:hypothetical protein